MMPRKVKRGVAKNYNKNHRHEDRKNYNKDNRHEILTDYSNSEDNDDYMLSDNTEK